MQGWLQIDLISPLCILAYYGASRVSSRIEADSMSKFKDYLNHKTVKDVPLGLLGSPFAALSLHTLIAV
jgi:hypothetical protein